MSKGMESFKHIRFFTAFFVVVANILVLLPLRTKATDSFILAGFIFYPESTLNLLLAYQTKIAFKGCTCRTFCLVDENCKAFTWVPEDDTFRCYFFDQDFEELTFTPDLGANTAVPLEQFRFTGEDDLRYYMHPYKTDFPTAVKTCKSLKDGSKLGMYKTMKQLKVLQELESGGIEPWVDMKAMGSLREGVWRDGTLYSTTEIGRNGSIKITAGNAFSAEDPPVFRFGYDDFNDRAKTDSFSVLCQSPHKD